MTMVNRVDCRTGEFYDPLRGCQLCSVVQSPYQMVLCPCEPSRDAVIGCRSTSFGSNICRPLSAAVDECIRRGYTSSRAPSTTAAADSEAVPRFAFTRISSAAAFAGESVQPSSTTVSGIINGNHPSSLSLDARSLLTLSIGVAVPCLIILLVAVAVFALLRRKTLLRRRDVEEHEVAEVSAKLIDRNSFASHLNVNNVSTPKEVVVNGIVPYVDQKPNVINNYNVVVKNSQFTQVGSHNVISVGQQVASAIGSASDSNSEDEEQVFSADDSDALCDVNVSVTSYLSDGACVGEVSFYHPMQGNDVDLSEAGYACPGNAEKSNTGEMRTEGFISASRSGEEQCQSRQASLEPGEAGTVSERSSVPGLLEYSDELTGTRERGNESAAPDISHMPIENADFFSQSLPESMKVPAASLPSGGTGSHIDSELLHSPPCDKEGRTPSVGGLCAGGVMASLAPASSSLSSRYISVDCGGDKESFPVHPQALQSINADKPGILASLSELPTGEAILNLDDDPTLPKQSTYPLPLLSVIGNHV